MAELCPKCGRAQYDGKRRAVQAFECVSENGTSCIAFRYGMSEGRRISANIVNARAQMIANVQGGHLVNGVVLCGELAQEIRIGGQDG